MPAERGASPKYVQHRLGHKNIQVTMQIYQHLTDKISEEGARPLLLSENPADKLSAKR